jgi:hypothetical protein
MNHPVTRELPYSNYYVAFLDILGFTDLVLSKKKNDKLKIEKYFELIKVVTERLRRIKSEHNFGSIIISDSVILSVPFGNNLTEKIDNLRQLLVAVGIIQFTLAGRNIWLRGGISSGMAYFNPVENAIVGPAYVNAYLLEQKHALFPRVLVDNKIIKELGKNSSQDLIDEINQKSEGGLNFQNWSSDILFDREGLLQSAAMLPQDIALFVDYLSPAFNDAGEFRRLMTHIELNIYSNNNIYKKFRWVVDYLMVSCEKYMQAHNRPDLRQKFSQLKRY